jgi:4-oxalocrotonate tautomerase
MPIINVQFIDNVVATPEQKQELVRVLTNVLVSVLGDVVRPFTYVAIEETKMGDWGLAGRPMPDPEFLIGDEYAAIHRRARELMAGAKAQTKAENPPVAVPSNGRAAESPNERAEKIWRGQV